MRSSPRPRSGSRSLLLACMIAGARAVSRVMMMSFFIGFGILGFVFVLQPARPAAGKGGLLNTITVLAPRWMHFLPDTRSRLTRKR